MKNSSRRFAKLLEAQNLIKARDEAELETSRRALGFVEEENRYLFALMQNGSNADYVNPLLIARRLERNRRKEGLLQAKIAEDIKVLLQTSRRCDMLEEKHRGVLEGEARKELGDMLEEFITARTMKSFER